MSGARARDEFRLHIRCHRSRRECKSVSFLTGIDQPRYGQKISNMNRQTRKEKIFIRPNRREIFREQQIANLQLIIERPRKAGANQIVEMLVMFAAANPSCGGQKFSHALTANLFSNASMKNFNRAVIDLAANR